ncbi:MAG: hypothetical protein KBG59_01390, partial [Lawsonibacter sp.]|nr:hypothetical protein [Lawsonibacter sp.]
GTWPDGEAEAALLRQIPVILKRKNLTLRLSVNFRSSLYAAFFEKELPDSPSCIFFENLV